MNQRKNRDTSYTARLESINEQVKQPSDGSLNTAYLCAEIRKAVPEDTIFAIEAVTNAVLVADHLRAHIPGSFINCGGGGLGWSGGGALGIKLASEALEGPGKRNSFAKLLATAHIFSAFQRASTGWQHATRYRF